MRLSALSILAIMMTAACAPEASNFSREPATFLETQEVMTEANKKLLTEVLEMDKHCANWTPLPPECRDFEIVTLYEPAKVTTSSWYEGNNKITYTCGTFRALQGREGKILAYASLLKRTGSPNTKQVSVRDLRGVYGTIDNLHSFYCHEIGQLKSLRTMPDIAYENN